MANKWHVQARIKANSGFPQDDAVNTWSFLVEDAATPTVNGGQITQALHAFYLSIGDYLANSISRGLVAIEYKLYNVSLVLGGQPHGSPDFIDFGSMAGSGQAAGAAGDLPTECALVTTLRAAGYAAQPVEGPDDADPDFAPERPRQRYTGRVYLGPFNDAANGVGGRPETPLTTRVLNGIDSLDATLKVQNAGRSIAVWSRQSAVMRAVVEAQVDNAWDTQRRRGVDPNTRFVRIL